MTEMKHDDDNHDLVLDDDYDDHNDPSPCS